MEFKLIVEDCYNNYRSIKFNSDYQRFLEDAIDTATNEMDPNEYLVEIRDGKEYILWDYNKGLHNNFP